LLLLLLLCAARAVGSVRTRDAVDAVVVTQASAPVNRRDSRMEEYFMMVERVG
jgi:hypothetical protein